MPRSTHNPADDPEITIRLKHGIHTIFLFAMPEWTFSKVTEELLEILRDRFPTGLSTTIVPPKTTPIPELDDDVKIVYAVPKTPNDLTQGWKNLKARDDDTLASKRIGDLTAVAFALADPEGDEDDVEFEVEIPTLDDVDYDQ